MKNGIEYLKENGIKDDIVYQSEIKRIWLSDLLDAYVIESNWISVKDRLPEFEIPEDEDQWEERFLTFNIFGAQLVRRYVIRKKGDNHFITLNGVSKTEVTHWQPLPSAPETNEK